MLSTLSTLSGEVERFVIMSKVRCERTGRPAVSKAARNYCIDLEFGT